MTIDPAVQEFTENIRERLKGAVKQIVLFGSRARGDMEQDSDYDFLIVLDHKDKALREQILEIEVEMMNRYGTLFASIVCDSQQWKNEQGLPLAINITKEGVIL